MRSNLLQILRFRGTVGMVEPIIIPRSPAPLTPHVFHHYIEETDEQVRRGMTGDILSTIISVSGSTRVGKHISDKVGINNNNLYSL